MDNNIINAPLVTNEIIIAGCRKFASENNYSDFQAEEIAINYSRSSDGYELAKDLERNCSWEIDCNTVEDLDMVSNYIDTEYKIVRKKWFNDNNIQSPFPIGTEIKEGVIHDIWDHDVAYYRVKRWGETNASRFGLIKFENAKLKVVDNVN